jgi:Tetratricopeptide repeat
MDLEALAPDAPEEAEEPVMELEALAPDAPEAPDEAEEPPAGGLLLTRTMADLYARQGFTERALEVYRELLEGDPLDAELRRRVAELEASVGESGPAGTAAAAADTPPPATEPDDEPDNEEEAVSGHVWEAQSHAEGHDVDTPFAWIADESEDAVPDGPPISSYFQRLLSWGAGGDGDAEEQTDIPAVPDPDTSGGSTGGAGTA